VEVLGPRGWGVEALETAGADATYEWERTGSAGAGFSRKTVFEDRVFEGIPAGKLRRGIFRALDDLKPDAVAVAGWGTVDARACLAWCKRNGVRVFVMSETRAADGRRVWWREWLKSRIVRKFDGGLCGGESHWRYLMELGIPGDRIALGYNVVDNGFFGGNRNAQRGILEGGILTTVEHGGGGEYEQPKVDSQGEGLGASESKETESTGGEGTDLFHGGRASTEHGKADTGLGLAGQACAEVPLALGLRDVGGPDDEGPRSELAAPEVSESLARSASVPVSTGHSVILKNVGINSGLAESPRTEVGGRRSDLAVGAGPLDSGGSTLDLEQKVLAGPYFLASNRFVERKNLGRLVEAYALYAGRANGRVWPLVLLGDGELRGELEEKVERLKLRKAGSRELAAWNLERGGIAESESLRCSADGSAVDLNAGCPAAAGHSVILKNVGINSEGSGGENELGIRASTLVSAAGCGLVVFAGFRQIGELPGFYRGAGVFVHPALEEPWGLVINEAMASGLTVISSRNVGAAEELVVEGVTGFLFDPGNVGELAGLMARVAGMPEGERRAMGGAARELVERKVPKRAFGEGLAKLIG
jgi:glycosyltransferase involved in cell wall biosynthesis